VSISIDELDVVEFTCDVGRWPAGTRATVLLIHGGGAAYEVEVGGHDFDDTPLEDFVFAVPHDAVRKADA
jgi:hypothetical protein